MLLFNKPNKTRLLSLNPKRSEISPLDGEIVYNLRKMLVSKQRRELVWFETITKHTLGWEIDERNLKIMNLTYFSPKMRGMSKTKKTTQSTSDLSTKHQTSEIYLRTLHLMSFCPRNTARLFLVDKEPPPVPPSKHKRFFHPNAIIKLDQTI